MAITLSMFIVNFLKGYDSSFQAIVIEKLLGQNLMQPCVLEYLQDLGRIKENHFVIENLKCGLSNHLIGHKSSPFVTIKEIVCSLATSDKASSSRKVV